MPLWTLLLVALGALGACALCPPNQLIYPCTCKVVIDYFADDFSVLSCKKLNSEDVLMKILAATRGHKLLELKIEDSTLRYIPHNAFLNTTFEVLNFKNSSIGALSDTNVAFEGLEYSLRLLEIINCSFLTNWDWTQLSRLKHMMEILVQRSDLLDITNALSTVQHLRFEAFVFEESNIEWLDSHVFAPFEELFRVTLDKNHIKHIERTMFPRPAKLFRILGLSYNKLTDLPKNIFEDMPVLSSLSLTGNPLQIIDEATFRPVWYQLNLFFFQNTKLSCDCRLSWFTKVDNGKKYTDGVCHSPDHVRGRRIDSLMSHELWC